MKNRCVREMEENSHGGAVVQDVLMIISKENQKKGGWGGCSAPQTITPLSSLSSGASWFEVIIIHNVQNIYNDKTDTVGKAGPLTSHRVAAVFSSWSTMGGGWEAFSFLPQLLLSLLGWSSPLHRTCECLPPRGCLDSSCWGLKPCCRCFPLETEI